MGIAIALQDQSANGCAAAYQGVQECMRLACASCPLVTSEKTFDERVACEQQEEAIDTLCATWIARYNVECRPLEDASAPELQRCQFGATFEADMRRFMRFWCTSAADAGDDADAN